MSHNMLDAEVRLDNLTNDISLGLRENMRSIRGAFSRDEGVRSVEVTGVLGQYTATIENSNGDYVDCFIEHPDSDETFSGYCFAIDTEHGGLVETAQHAFIDAMENVLNQTRTSVNVVDTLDEEGDIQYIADTLRSMKSRD